MKELAALRTLIRSLIAAISIPCGAGSQRINPLKTTLRAFEASFFNVGNRLYLSFNRTVRFATFKIKKPFPKNREGLFPCNDDLFVI
jgi:hypothetical protein